MLQTRNKRKLFNKNGGKLLETQGITIYTTTQLKEMTKNYSKRLGGGAFGDVYEGSIAGSNQVAVKRSKLATSWVTRWQKMIGPYFGVMVPDQMAQHHQEEDSFVNEITFQFKIKHINVVQLLGCCLETDVPILVYEFVSNGSLDVALHGTHRPCTDLTLQKRLDIAIGSAEALNHMHTNGEYKHVHGDVKPANILLDGDLKPMVSDFGSSKLLMTTRNYARAVAADLSYLDPVYLDTGHFTVKSDVYSFGVVLLELITRKKASYDAGTKNLRRDFVKCCKEEGNGRRMYDRDILLTADSAPNDVYIQCLDRIGALAVRCLNEDPDERPSMAEVLEELKQVKL